VVNKKMKFIFRLLINALAILLVAYLIPGITVSGFWAALIMAIVLGIINALISPLVKILTLPISILTLGLFTLVINALMFLLASYFVTDVEINSFASAFWGALIISIISWLTNQFLKKKKRRN
jgi:putative membrane protein